MTRTVAYCVYSEAGGVGKSTLAANLAKAHSLDGEDVLLIDLDPQEGSLSYLLGVERPSGEADNIVRHLVGRPKGDFSDLITDADGMDIIPSTPMLSDLLGYMFRAAENNDDFDRNSRLHQLLVENEIADQYSVIVIDPPATASTHLYNAIVATRSLVLPIELSGKGQKSVEGLSSIVADMQEKLEISIGVPAVVPNNVKHTTDQEAYRQRIEDAGYPAPVVIDDRTSLMQGCWDKQCTAFTFVEQHRSRKRDYEEETLREIEELAEHIETKVRG
jgi:chromosome partitioning protein